MRLLYCRKYCVFDPTSCEDETKVGVGECQPVDYIGEYKMATVNGHNYAMSDCATCPDWWTAQSWCKAFGMRMVSLEDIHCTDTGCTDTYWQDLRAALYKYGGWTASMNDTCRAFRVSFSAGGVFYSSRHTKSHDAFCIDN